MIASMKLLPALLLVAPAGAALAQPPQPGMAHGGPGMMMNAMHGPVVNLSVTESVDGAPDKATISTGVETRAPTARDAMTQNATQMDKLITALIKAGVDRKDIQTGAINLNPQYDYSNQQRDPGQGPRFIGYIANNMVTVTLRKLDKAGETVDAMVAAGATNINGPTFGIEDSSNLEAQARAKAVKSGQARADFYAQAAGYKSARLLDISESGQIERPIIMTAARMMTSADAAPKTRIEPGQLSTSITLSFRYMLER